MARHDNLYSRLVAWLKLLLPLVALGILSTVFLVARETEFDRPVIEATAFADRGVQRIEGPTYSGITRDGTAVAIAAEVAWPDPADPQQMLAEGLSARFDLPGGDAADVVARQGKVDQTGQHLRLSDKIEVATTSGWTMTTDRLDAKLDWTSLTAPEGVHSAGPMGELRANVMTISRGEPEAQSYLMQFDGDVHLTYRPDAGR